MNTARRIILIDVISPRTHHDVAVENLDELKSLVATYNGIDIAAVIQHRTHPDKSTFIGAGKVVELIELVKTKKADIVVINAVVSPSILFNLTKQLWDANHLIQVWDRVDLILHIFDRHAHTAEAKLQIEIASMRHMGPRIYGLGGTYFSRQGGGIGGRGAGETNIELMKRHWRRAIKVKKDELDVLVTQRNRQHARRRESNMKTVAIVGYTNAGKSSLYNVLSRKNKLAEDALFVTLDATYARVYIGPDHPPILLSDTIGFIRDLPSSLIDSFKSTLSAALEADILLHVIDVTDPRMNEKIATVEHILHEIGSQAKHTIYVFNKVDAHTGRAEELLEYIRATYASHNPTFISARDNYGIDTLKKRIAECNI